MDLELDCCYYWKNKSVRMRVGPAMVSKVVLFCPLCGKDFNDKDERLLMAIREGQRHYGERSALKSVDGGQKNANKT